MKLKFLSGILLLLPLSQGYAQSEADSLLQELNNLSAYEQASALQKSLNSEFQAGAIQGASSREVPNIVSFITASDIRNSGARDLVDVLRLVPGFDFGTDVESAVGPVMRGNWAMEGKVLLLIDGIEMNELAYQTLFFSHHYPVDIIERIEVIRGPGSAIYGGTAEYGVINIITKGKQGPEGVGLNATYGQLGHAYGRRNASLSLRKSILNAMLDVTGSIGSGNRSDDTHISFTQDTINLATSRSAYVQPTFLNVGIKSGGLEVRALYDSYRWRTRLYEIDNRQFATYATYQFKLGNKTTLSPRISYANQLPWHFTQQFSQNEDDWYHYKVRVQRLVASINLNHRFTRRLSLSSGIESQYQQGRDLLHIDGEEGNFGENPTTSFTSHSVYSQLFWKNYFANLTGGLRYEYREGFGGAVVPRLAATRHMNRWHVKLLYSHAYRMPGIENLNLAVGELKPEISKVAEAELGYQLTKNMLLAVNTFRMKVKDIIVYGYDISTLEESYINEEATGTKGIEANFQVQQARWRSQLTYSFYKPIKGNTVTDYQVEGQPQLYLGIPAHKVTYNGTFNISKRLHLNSSAIWHSERWGYTRFAGEDEQDYHLQHFAPYLLLNTFLRYEHLLPGLHLGAGVYNLLDEQHRYIQPYAGENAPAPSTGREWVLKLQYELPLGK